MTKGSMTIKKVLSEDLETLRALAERTFRDAWQDDNTPENFETYCSRKFSAERFREEYEQPGSEFYLGTVDEKPVAYIKLNLHTSPAEFPDISPAIQLERIYVLQGFQAHQFGARLLEFSEDRAVKTGAQWLWLGVWQKAPRAIGFYEKNGFEIFGVETFWLGDDPQTDWLMKKKC
ncbi:MAG: GNAT family N-acetyltransferase [Saprospiraceae bacterium]|nr:GNAT family N-acetyltransferase [Saprospiraceae bacterium]